MKVYFQNSYSSTVWVAVLYYSPDACREYGQWARSGWWKVEPGNRAWAISTNNRYAYFYAEAEDGSFWSGGTGPITVYRYPFDLCIDLGVTWPSKLVGMRLIDTQHRDTIIDLRP